MPLPVDWERQQTTVLREYRASPDRFGGSYDQLFSKLVWTETATSWIDINKWLSELRGSWCFRGQRDASWPLHTSLDRAVRVTTSHGHYHLDRKSEENELLFKFQQQAHQFIGNVPANEDKASWVALMQHYGVPTRLLDWTRSPYVALYFAMEETPRDLARTPAVYAMNMLWLETKEKECLGSVPVEPRARTDYLNSILEQSDKHLIVRIDPTYANERMFAQQGFFLWKLFEGVPAFDQILVTMMMDPMYEQPIIRKLEIQEHLRIEFLENLRSMNIHRASLFPGLDGFCQALRLGLEIKVANEASTTARLDHALENAFGRS